MARKLRDFPAVALSIEDFDGKIDFARVFGRNGPVHIEIGCGKATFILNQARAEPQVNFLAIERANKYYRYAVDRIGRWGLTNVRIVRTDAAFFLARFVPDHSVDCFHIYFPDPWPKRRHHKRRFFCQANLDQLIRTLKTGGIIKIVTDHPDYFQTITNLLQANERWLKPTEFVPAAGAQEGEFVGTNYERKYKNQNRMVYAVAVVKTQSPA